MKLLDQRVGWGASSFYLSGFSLAGEEAEPGEGTKGRVKGLADPLGHWDGGRPQLLKTSSWLPWGGVAQAGRLRSHQQRCEEISKWCCCFSARRRLLPGPHASPSPGAAEVLAAGSLSVCLSVCLSQPLVAVLWGQRELLVTGQSALFGVPAARTDPLPVILAGCERRGYWRISEGISCPKSEQNGGK